MFLIMTVSASVPLGSIKHQGLRLGEDIAQQNGMYRYLHFSDVKPGTQRTEVIGGYPGPKRLSCGSNLDLCDSS